METSQDINPVAWLHQICDDQGNGSVIASLNENIDLDASEVCVSTPLYAHPDPRIAALEADLAAAQAERDTALTDTHDRIADLEAEVKDRIAELQRTYEVIRSHAQLTFKAEDERDEARAEAAALRVNAEAVAKERVRVMLAIADEFCGYDDMAETLRERARGAAHE